MDDESEFPLALGEVARRRWCWRVDSERRGRTVLERLELGLGLGELLLGIREVLPRVNSGLRRILRIVARASRSAPALLTSLTDSVDAAAYGRSAPHDATPRIC